MTDSLSLAAARVAPLAPREHRKATQLDRLRVAEIARRIDEGDDELTAAWTVMSDEKIGLPRWRGATERPSDVTLSRKFAALLTRAAPAMLERARDLTMARVGRLADKAVRTLDEVTGGEFDDPARARVQLDGAKTVLEAVGVGGRSAAPASVHAVQVNVDLRQSVERFRDLLVADPEAAEHARALGARLAR